MIASALATRGMLTLATRILRMIIRVLLGLLLLRMERLCRRIASAFVPFLMMNGRGWVVVLNLGMESAVIWIFHVLLLLLLRLRLVEGLRIVPVVIFLLVMETL